MARRYATALADVVVAHGEASEVQIELSRWESMMESSPALLEVFRNPTIAYDQKRNVLNALIARTRVRATTANFLQVLLRNQRLTDIGEINKRLARELDDRSGMVVAQVSTARPVPPAVQEGLSDRLSRLTGRRVKLQFSVDEDLIGGVSTRIGSTIYDGSVRTQLQQIRERMVGKQ
jgi:F-type H+-transporting ATPase subunit delta